MLTLVLMMAAATSRPMPITKMPNYKIPAARPMRCRGKCAEQYRLPEASESDPDAKDRAMAQDGSRCNVVGAQRCLSKTRTILRSNENPAATLSASFLPQ